MYTLYYHPYSQHCRRVVALLEEAGLKYELRQVALDQGEHMSPAYLAINPNHQVPAMIDGELRVFESNAILRYLCHKHRLSDWYPEDPARLLEKLRSASTEWQGYCLYQTICGHAPSVTIHQKLIVPVASRSI